MLLGKRPRPPMKRTTSLSDISADPNAHIPSGPDQRAVHVAAQPPHIYRRHSADLTAEFLRSCSLCKRPLIPSRDIYMYKGDSAFCSVECREQAMKRDERKEKCSLASSKKIANHRHHAAPSSNAETVGAAV